MPTSYSTLLGLALPVTGELSGTWGDEVNNYITQYLDAAVAGVQTISGSQTAVTLSRTTNASLSQAGSGATGSSQYQIINCTGNPATALTVTVPSTSKVYVVLNNTSTSQTVTVKGAATTGVTVAAARSALIAWNGTDFELVATDDASKMNGVLAAVNGGTGQSSYTTGDILYASSSTALAKLADVATGNALISGGVGVAPSYGKIGLTTHVSGTLPTANGGTNLTSFTSGGAVYATSTSALTTGTLPVASGGTGVTTSTGSGSVVLSSSPALTTPNLGTPSAATLTNATGLPLSTGVTGTLPVANGGTGLTSTPANGALDIGNGTGFTRATLTAGSGVSISNGSGSITISATGSGGSVTSVGLSAPSFLSVSGSPVTTSGTLALSYSGTALPVANGGTGQTSYTDGQLLIGNSGTGGLSKSALTAGSGISISNGGGSITIAATGGSGTVTSVAASGGTTGLTFSGSPITTSGTLTLGGTLAVANGGTGVTSSTGSGSVVLSTSPTLTTPNLGTPSAATLTNATGLPLSSGVTGTLPVGNGGTGTATVPGNGALLIGNGSTYTVANLTAGSGINITNASGSVTIASTVTGTVTSVGLSMPTGFSVSGSPVTSSGTLSVTTSLSGVIKGTGSGLTAATAGTDFVAPGTATTFTALQTFSGTSSNFALKVTDMLEVATVSATAATGTINYDITTQSVIYYTSNAAANWTVNLRASSGTSLNTAMATGEATTVAFLVTQGSTAYYNSTVQVDGTTSGVTTKWQGGAPTAGNASGIDVYTYTVIKTGSAAFTVLASVVQFK